MLKKERNNMYDESGLPEDKSYLECGLPPFLQESIEKMKRAWILKETEGYIRWDCDYCELQSNINVAEVCGAITEDQAWYIREKYLYIERH